MRGGTADKEIRKKTEEAKTAEEEQVTREIKTTKIIKIENYHRENEKLQREKIKRETQEKFYRAIEEKTKTIQTQSYCSFVWKSLSSESPKTRLSAS